MFSFPLLGRSRSWAVLSLLSFFALSLPCAAQYPGGGSGGGGYPGASAYIGGGSYVGPTYTGGTVTTSVVNDYSLDGNGTYYGGQYYASGGTSVTCSGEIKTAYHWGNTDPNLVPPHCVIVVEHCIAQWHGSASGGGTVTGGCANPLGGSPVPDVPGPGATWEFTSYTVQSGAAPDGPLATVTISSSPGADVETANGNGPNPVSNGTAHVQYNAGPIIPPQLQAHSTVDTANWDPFHPRFFSGTNCSVGSTATAYRTVPGTYPTGGTYVVQASLSIGGTVVKHYYDSSLPGPHENGAISGTNQGNVPISAFFDSTHFADNTPISIQMSVTDSGGLSYMVPVHASAYNKAYVLGNNTLAYGSTSEQYIATRASSMNTTPFGTTSDVKQTILSSIPIYTDFYIDTHGYPGDFGDCYAHPDSSDQYYLYADSHNDPTGSQSVTMAVQSKTVNEPPYNFVDLDDCYTAGNSNPTDRNAPYGIDSTLATAFGVNGPDDCAILGWTTETDDSARNANFANQVWLNMGNGQTLATALSNAENLYPPQLNAVDNAAKPLTFGDGSTTLHRTVYGGTLGNWFR